MEDSTCPICQPRARLPPKSRCSTTVSLWAISDGWTPGWVGGRLEGGAQILHGPSVRAEVRRRASITEPVRSHLHTHTPTRGFARQTEHDKRNQRGGESGRMVPQGPGHSACKNRPAPRLDRRVAGHALQSMAPDQGQ